MPELPPLETGGGILEGEPAPIDELAPPAGAQVTQEQIEGLIRFPFAFIALRRGAHWKLHDDEAAMVAEPLTRKINEHAIAARLLAAGGDYALIGGGLALIISSRLAEDDQRARDRAAHSQPGTGRIPDRDDGRRRDTPGGADARRDQPTLNGFRILSRGSADDGGPAAVDPEAPSGPLSQAL